MDPSQFVIVLTTFPVDEDANTLARTLVSERLAACVNVLPPMPSIYRGRQRRRSHRTPADHQDDRPSSRRAEAAAERAASLRRAECLVLSVADGGTAYLEWLREALD